MVSLETCLVLCSKRQKSKWIDTVLFCFFFKVDMTEDMRGLIPLKQER